MKFGVRKKRIPQDADLRVDAGLVDGVAERRDKPADDLLTDLIAMEEAGDKLSTDELVMMVNAVIIGGTDTTRNQLGCALGLFAEHPDQWALLAERPELAQRAVDFDLWTDSFRCRVHFEVYLF